MQTALLSVDDMLKTIKVVGENGDWKEMMSHKDTPPRVKDMMRALQICVGNQVGSSQHRTVLRHISHSYTQLWGQL